MRIEIYRFGNYVNAVDDLVLREWIIKNLPMDNEEGALPEDTPLDECLELAKKAKYTFKTEADFDDYNKLLDKVRIEDVASKFFLLKKKGENYIFSCPFCGADASGYISPKHQIYKCFACGKSGTVISLVMEFKNLTFAGAIKYIKKLYNID